MEGDEIANFAVEEHNKLRRKYGVREIHGDAFMHKDAQKYADFLARYDKLEGTTMGKYATNLAMSTLPEKIGAIEDSMKRMVDGNEFYLRPQIRRMGFGMARMTTGIWVIVTFYELPGLAQFGLCY